ncbi:MAG: prepilin peptidase [Patescibacteria group bacterium]|nr:prepilin peptidase [Patescibacteria group bacterium]
MTLLMLLIFVFAFGLIIGSFLNCLIWRLHKNESLLGRSYCPKCREQISWYDNVPLLSFIMLRGKCRHCGKPISWQYPAVELATAILFVISFVINFKFMPLDELPNFQFSILTLRNFFLISVMIVVFIYDLRWYLILDTVTLPACLLVFILNLILDFNLWNLLFSGIIGGGFFLIQFVISGGKWIGGGDIRLGLLMGLGLGWPGVLLATIISYFIGSAVGIGLLASGKKKWGSEVPLGIFLAAGTIISLFWQTPILNWYLNLF